MSQPISAPPQIKRGKDSVAQLGQRVRLKIILAKIRRIVIAGNFVMNALGQQVHWSCHVNRVAIASLLFAT